LQGLGDLLAVGAHVLHRGGAGRTGDAGERLDAAPALGDGGGHHLVPRLAGRDGDERAGAGVAFPALPPAPPLAPRDTRGALGVDDTVDRSPHPQGGEVGEGGRPGRGRSVGSGGGSHPPNLRPARGRGRVAQCRRTTAWALASTVTPAARAVRSTRTVPASASSAPTRPVTSSSTSPGSGTRIGRVNRVP